MAEPVRFRQVDQMLMDSFTSGELLGCSQLEREQHKENSRAPATSPQVTSHLKRVVAIIYQLKRFLLLHSHCLHLLRPSSLEHHYRHQEVSLQSVIESSKSFVKELNRFSELTTLRIQQMKYSLSQLQVLQSGEQSINKQLIESFLARDLQDHPLLELDEVRSRRYKRKLKTPSSCMNKLLKAGA